MASSLLFSRPLPSNTAPSSCRIPRRILTVLRPFSYSRSRRRPLAVFSTLAESDSPKSLGGDEPPLRLFLQELADSFELPSDYLAKLPRDLRLDLNDAAFDLSNGPVIDECGQKLGTMLLNLSRAWEQADTSTSQSITSQFLSLEGSLTDNAKFAFGKRLLSAGRRFTSMGQYGQGELQRIANVMVKTGKLLSATPVTETDVKPKIETKTFKFGELQVELTPDKAYSGAAIAFAFGILSWYLTQGIQSIPESSLQYENDNALLLAKSLRGALLAIGYGSTILSEVSSVALLLLARQLSSDSKS